MVSAPTGSGMESTPREPSSREDGRTGSLSNMVLWQERVRNILLEGVAKPH
jgi:hypothetical protein